MSDSEQPGGAPATIERHDDSELPHARPADPMDPHHDQLNGRQKSVRDRQEALIDEAVEETFPASDPVSAKRIT